MVKQEKTAAKIGRPSTFTEEMGEEICRRVSQGESLRQGACNEICVNLH